MEDKCIYCCETDGDVSKDIFFEYLKVNPFGINDDTYNPDVTVYISDSGCLRMTVMFGDEVVRKDEIRIKYCPFCGRRLYND